MPTNYARLLCLLILLQPLPAWAEALQLFSVEAPPLTSNEAGQHGLVGEVVLAALAAEKLDYVLHTPPWPRAQKQVQEGRDLLIMPLSRIPSREQLYTWITPIYHVQRAFFSIGPPVRSMAEARLQLRQRFALERRQLRHHIRQHGRHQAFLVTKVIAHRRLVQLPGLGGNSTQRNAIHAELGKRFQSGRQQCLTAIG